MKLKRLISLVLTVLMIASVASIAMTANAAEIETVSTGAYNEHNGYGKYYNATYLENKAYSGNDLGATYTPSKTTWKVWSPEAKKVTLNLYATGSDLEVGAENLGNYALKLDRMYKGTLKEGDLDKFTPEQVEEMKAYCAKRNADITKLYETAYEMAH